MLCAAFVLSVWPGAGACAQSDTLLLSAHQWQALDDSVARNPFYLATLPRDSAVALIKSAIATRDSGIAWAAFGPGVCGVRGGPQRPASGPARRAAYGVAYDCLASLHALVDRGGPARGPDSVVSVMAAMLLEPMAEAAVEAGRLAESDSLAVILLNRYVSSGGFMAGNIIHNANQVRGRVALRRGDVAGAERFLAAAGATPGSPQLNSFGPKFSLARELIEAGETEAVLAYLAAVRRFLRTPNALQELDAAEADIRAGRIPTGVRWR